MRRGGTADVLHCDDRALTDNEILTGLQNAAVGEVIEVLDLRGGDVDPLGDGPERVARLHGANDGLLKRLCLGCRLLTEHGAQREQPYPACLLAALRC